MKKAAHAPPESPSIGLALGAGGARGLAHIVVLEALDDLGLKPAVIAGTSMGAIIGAAYAAGISGKDIRQHVLGLVRDKADVMARLLRARVGRLTDLFTRGLSNPVLLDGEIFLEQFWPKAMPERFEDLSVNFIAVATDFLTHEAAIFNSGPLRPAVAGSMAIPGLIRPVSHEAQVLIDGGAVNPLPYLQGAVTTLAMAGNVRTVSSGGVTGPAMNGQTMNAAPIPNGGTAASEDSGD